MVGLIATRVELAAAKVALELLDLTNILQLRILSPAPKARYNGVHYHIEYFAPSWVGESVQGCMRKAGYNAALKKREPLGLDR